MNAEKSEDGVRQVHLKPTKNIAWRVGVRDGQGRRSQTFKIHTRRAAGQPRDDIYICGRSLGGNMKVSLHASGDRQVSLDTKYVEKNPLPEGRSRHFDTWKEPVKEAGGLYFEYSLIFPTDHLRPIAPRKDSEVVWIQAPPAGQALELILCTTDQARDLRLTCLPGTCLIAADLMTDHRYMLLLARVGPARRPAKDTVVAAHIAKSIAELGADVDPAHRVLIGFRNDDGLRGWVDYALEQFLAEARQRESA